MPSDDLPQDFDPALEAALSRGDPDAFTKVVAKYYPAILFYFSRMIKGPTAEDATQDVFLSVLNNYRRFDRTRGNIGQWLRGCLVRNIRKRVTLLQRRNPKCAEPSELEQFHRELTDELTDDSTKPAGLLRNAIDSLPRVLRKVIRKWLSLNGDASISTLADALGKKPGTVRVSLWRARNAIRQFIEENKNVSDPP